MEFGTLLNRKHTRRIVVHHSASADVSADQIHQWHLNKGWSGIGYHYVIRKSGDIEPGRPVDTVGAHTIGYNGDSIGICLTGNFQQHSPSPEQITSLVKLIQELEKKYGKLELNRHRDLAATACPGELFDWEDLHQLLTPNSINPVNDPSPAAEPWKQELIQQARTAELITGDHQPDDPSPKWFVLAVALNLLKSYPPK